jgi:hypothetical protein
MSNLVYRNTVIYTTATILMGTTYSNMVSLVDLPCDTAGPDGMIQAAGVANLRRINFPANWTTCDVTFNVSEGLALEDAALLRISDGADQQPLTMTSVSANAKIKVQPWWFDTEKYIQIVSSVAQSTNVTLQLVLASIYQGNA